MRLGMEKIRNKAIDTKCRHKDPFVVSFLFYLESLCKKAEFRNVLAAF